MACTCMVTNQARWTETTMCRGSRLLGTDPQRVTTVRERMKQPPYLLDQDSRVVVLQAIREVCLHRGSNLLAAYVRTTHVHVVVESEVRPEKIMNAFKSYASRGLNGLKCETSDRKRWARHGSTRWLWQDQDVRDAIRYVVEEQGEPMAVFVGEML